MKGRCSVSNGDSCEDWVHSMLRPTALARPSLQLLLVQHFQICWASFSCPPPTQEPKKSPFQESHQFLLDACVLMRNIKYIGVKGRRGKENRYHISFLLKYASAMPLSTQSDLRLLLGVILTIHLLLPNTFCDSKYTLARQWVGGYDAANVWDCPTWELVHIFQCSHKCAAGTQGLFFFFNCLENFMLFFLIPCHEHTNALCIRKNPGTFAA